MSSANLGSAIAFALQQGNMARIFQTLGADLASLPILMIAGPVTGLIVQPLIGHYSDHTWGPLGRRRPYFLAGALVAAAALVVMAHARSLALAIGAFWLLDCALNVVIEPFRAFVGDMVPASQRARALAINAAMGCAGAVAGFLAPYALGHLAPRAVAGAGISGSVALALEIAAGVLLAGVGFTVARVREYSPAELAAFAGESAPEPDDHGAIGGIFRALAAMPAVLRRLAVIQCCTWFALFIMWPFMTPVITASAFHAAGPASPAYNAGADWVGVLFAGFNVVAALFGAFGLPMLAARAGTARAHGACLGAGVLGYLLVMVITDPAALLLPFALLGIAWASILTLPYVILTDCLGGHRLGTYTGLFNIFIVLPQIAVALVMGPVVKYALGGAPLGTMALAAGAMALAALLTLRLPARAAAGE